MDLQGVKSLMEEGRWSVLASTDGKIVGVRPMGTLGIDGRSALVRHG